MICLLHIAYIGKMTDSHTSSSTHLIYEMCKLLNLFMSPFAIEREYCQLPQRILVRSK